MIKKTPLTFWIAGLLTALAIIISGCSTKKPWGTNPNIPFAVSFISAPTDSVPANVHTSFSWAVTGGTGAVTSQYRVGDNAWSEQAAITTATLSNLAVGTYTFSVQAQDAEGHTATASTSFIVKEAAAIPPDTIPPYVSIIGSPAESSFVAVGSVVAFAWTGFDSLGSGADLLFQYSFGDETSEWLPIRTVTFNNVSAANPATFTVRAKDVAGNISTTASMVFFIKIANILYVDDYQWLDTYGYVDRAKERDQKGFYREALKGYAFAEWDIAAQGMPDSAYIIQFSTVVFASDTKLNDGSDTWWVDVGDVHGGVLRYYMEHNGHLLATGASVLRWIYNTNPPAAGDFEYDWFGLDSTGGWDYWADFTWAVKAPATNLDLPDSMKIDVAKNGTQVDYAENIFGFRPNVQSIFVKGLDVDGGEPRIMEYQ